MGLAIHQDMNIICSRKNFVVKKFSFHAVTKNFYANFFIRDISRKLDWRGGKLGFPKIKGGGWRHLARDKVIQLM